MMLSDVTIGSNDLAKVSFSRTFVERDSSGTGMNQTNKRQSSVDTKNVSIYFKRQASRASIQSATSIGATSSTDGTPTLVRSLASSDDVTDDNGPQSSAITVATRITAHEHVSRSTLPSHLIGGTGRSASVPNLLVNSKRSKFAEGHLDVCQIVDYLYMGNIESSYNANLLCKLNVGYIVDASNVEPNQVPRDKRSDCPCICPLKTGHSRTRMTLSVEENCHGDMSTYFYDVSRLVKSAKSCGKNVLISSYHGRNRCAALVAAYLMQSRKIDFKTAERLLSTAAPRAKITDNFQHALKCWETQLGLSGDNAITTKSQSPGFGISASAVLAKKKAWS